MLLAALSPTAYAAFIFVGFLVGAFGHLIESKPTVAAGIGLVLLATVLFQVRVAP